MTLPGRLPQRFMLGVWAVPLLYDRSAHPTSSIRRKRKLGLAGEEEEPPPSDPAEYAAVKRWDEIRSTDRKEALPFHIMIGCSYTQYVIYRHNTGWMTLGGSDRLMADGGGRWIQKCPQYPVAPATCRRILHFAIIHLFIFYCHEHMTYIHGAKAKEGTTEAKRT